MGIGARGNPPGARGRPKPASRFASACCARPRSPRRDVLAPRRIRQPAAGCPGRGAATLPGAQRGRRHRAARCGECPAVARRCRGCPARQHRLRLAAGAARPDRPVLRPAPARCGRCRAGARAAGPTSRASPRRSIRTPRAAARGCITGGMRWRPARSPTPSGCGGRGPAPGAARPGRRPAGRGPRPRPCRRRGGDRGGPAQRAALAGGG